MKISANMGSLDRALRILAGFALVALGYLGFLGSLGWIAVLVGCIFLLTSVFSFCPLYTIFGIRTCPLKKD